MEKYTLLSPEKVYLNLNLAGVGSRFVAFLIDTIFKYLLIGVVIGGLILSQSRMLQTFKSFDPENVTAWWSVITFILLIIAILSVYHIFFETLWNGQTPGKKILKLRVIQENGSSVTFLKVLIRNTLRIIDSLPTMYAIAIVSVLLSKKSQRLGDMAAGTVIIRETVTDTPVAMDFELVETPWSGSLRLNIHKLNEDDFTVLKKYLLRRETLKWEESYALDQKLSHVFSEKLGLKLEETANPLVFLTQIAAQYQRRFI